MSDYTKETEGKQKSWFEETRLLESNSRCLVCKKLTLVKTGWHFPDDFHFCSNKCVYAFLDNLLTRLKTLDKRIEKIEERLCPQ